MFDNGVFQYDAFQNNAFQVLDPDACYPAFDHKAMQPSAYQTCEVEPDFCIPSFDHKAFNDDVFQVCRPNADFCIPAYQRNVFQRDVFQICDPPEVVKPILTWPLPAPTQDFRVRELAQLLMAGHTETKYIDYKEFRQQMEDDLVSQFILVNLINPTNISNDFSNVRAIDEELIQLFTMLQFIPKKNINKSKQEDEIAQFFINNILQE